MTANSSYRAQVDLKKGKFKPSYLGQLQAYLSILDGFEKKPHENPSIGLILCKDMNKTCRKNEQDDC